MENCIVVTNQAGQPILNSDHSFECRRSEYQRKLGRKREHRAMYYLVPYLRGLSLAYILVDFS